MSAAAAVSRIHSGDTVATGGFVGIGFAENIAVALAERYALSQQGGERGVPENLTLDLSCSTVFAAGRRPVAVRGPFPELEAEVLRDHDGFW